MITEKQAADLNLQFNIERDVPKLKKLAEHNVFLGTSSWKYQEWRDRVYLHGNYAGARKPFVKKQFEDNCLEEYAKYFKTVCMDGIFYRLPDYTHLKRLADQLPDDFLFSAKTTDQITLYRYNYGHPQAGEKNSGYLDIQTFIEHYLAPISEAFGKKLGVIIFQFSPFDFGGDEYTKDRYIDDLYKFFDRIPNKEQYKFAVEVRDRVLIEEDSRYFDVLEYHGISHVLNQQGRMPEVNEQLKNPRIYTAPFTVARLLSRPGQSHDQAKKAYEPYTHIQQPQGQLRLAVNEIIRHSLEYQRQLLLFQNNRTEGNAPDSLANEINIFEQDLIERPIPGLSW